MKNLEMYCVTNKTLDFLEGSNYAIGWVGQEKPPQHYLTCDTEDNIFFKEKYYSELTFQYWFWKNKLNLDKKNWIGFCQKRRFWIKEDSNKKEINTANIKNHILNEIPEKYLKYDSIICDPIHVNKVKKMKLIKRGFRSILKDPGIFFDFNKQSLLLHFDMHHGYGNMEKAIKHLNERDKHEFFNYLERSTFYNPHIMFIAKPHIVNRWFSDLFSWLFECEKTFGFKKLYGYDTQRLYAYLAERYLSFWFKKHTNYINLPWAFVE
jgi:hypothetical protein